MSKALLICNGEKPGKWLKKYATQADFILAADGGADAALAAGVIPDAVIGDLDSVSHRLRRQLKDTPFIHIKRQDNTDLEKALDWLTIQQFNACTIVGATGGRLDFTLGNILAVRPYLKKIDIFFRGPNWSLQFITKTYKFTACKGARASLIPLTACKAVSLKGFLYPLKNENIGQSCIGRSLSNQISAAKSEVSCAGG